MNLLAPEPRTPVMDPSSRPAHGLRKICSQHASLLATAK
eukprot:CAMPEP_0204257486 /NCGR_PEP_ID=MMETSP0468-20130131/4460_1 /ASSEMBLY_ACC=CAM_ASM_000383 /TAXON_ID=2969 /ORGANISM="Oxyrrhis marina" /LENGTH=38 /DNA_ID= /DNA_START= /DNA_END= /DNA_ORIENTATION=